MAEQKNGKKITSLNELKIGIRVTILDRPQCYNDHVVGGANPLDVVSYPYTMEITNIHHEIGSNTWSMTEGKYGWSVLYSIEAGMIFANKDYEITNNSLKKLI